MIQLSLDPKYFITWIVGFSDTVSKTPNLGRLEGLPLTEFELCPTLQFCPKQPLPKREAHQ